jgi:prepilin-type N-terminal cleavage/methylation domain-containing protein
MWAKQKQTSGFTIVELLIVIVIIGILAAITIVAYNGIQERARISSLQSSLTSIGKMAQVYQTNDGTFPASDAGVKEILQKANAWDSTRAPATHTYLFCAGTDKYAVISLSAPGIPSYSSSAGATVHYWSTDKGAGKYTNTTGDANWTPNCNLAIGAITWRQVSSSVN